jgi:hypothetical protein
MSPRSALPALCVLLAVGCDRGPQPPAAQPDTLAAASYPPPAPDSSLLARLQQMERAALDALPAGPGRDQVAAACVPCHSPQMFTAQRKDRAAWAKTVSSMVAWGAPLPAGQQEAVVRYLAEHYGRGAGVTSGPHPAR